MNKTSDVPLRYAIEDGVFRLWFHENYRYEIPIGAGSIFPHETLVDCLFDVFMTDTRLFYAFLQKMYDEGKL